MTVWVFLGMCFWFDFLMIDFIGWDDWAGELNVSCFYHKGKERFRLEPSFFFAKASYQDHNQRGIYKKFCTDTFLVREKMNYKYFLVLKKLKKPRTNKTENLNNKNYLINFNS